MKTPIPEINFSFFDQKLIASFNEKDFSIGLASGRMGFCIYFYVLSRVRNDIKYKSVAETLLDDVIKNIAEDEVLDIHNGLTGIGLGIDYLIREKYVRGNINEILQSIDDVVFEKLSYSQHSKSLSQLTIMHLLFYLDIRLSAQRKGSEQEYLFRELIIQTINTLYERIELGFFEEPSTFSIDYQLPLFLYILNQIYKQSFYNYRIDKIIDELASKIFSILPVLHANRLFLLWSMSILQREKKSLKWMNHILLLANNLDMDKIVTDELRDKNIFFNNGLTGIYLLAEATKDHFSAHRISNFKENILTRIYHSQIWEMIRNNAYFDPKNGLLDGYCGVSILLQTIKYRQQ